VKDRPPRGHGVTGGARWSRQNQAVSAHLIDHLTIDFQLEDAGGSKILAMGSEIKIIEGPVTFGRISNRATAAAALLHGTAQIATVVHRGLEHHPSLDRELILGQALPELHTAQQRGVMGEKAQMAAHVETQDWHVVNGQMASRPQHGAITP